MVGITAPLGALRLLSRLTRDERRQGYGSSARASVVMALLLAVNAVLMALAIGRPNLAPSWPAGLHRAPYPMRCERAVMYGAELAHNVSAHLRVSAPSRRPPSVDALMAQALRQWHTPDYVWSPSLWQALDAGPADGAQCPAAFTFCNVPVRHSGLSVSQEAHCTIASQSNNALCMYSPSHPYTLLHNAADQVGENAAPLQRPRQVVRAHRGRRRRPANAL